MQNQLFENALGITKPWYVAGVDFDAAKRSLTISVDFVAGSRFAAPAVAGAHPVHDTQLKRLRHLNFFQHECFLEVRTPRVKLPDGRVVLVEPDWFGKLSGFTLLFEALVLAMAQHMTFAAVAKLVGLSWHRVHAICSRYVDLALSDADLSTVQAVAIDETSCQRGHNYLTIAADAEQRRVVFVTEGKDGSTITPISAGRVGLRGSAERQDIRRWIFSQGNLIHACGPRRPRATQPCPSCSPRLVHFYAAIWHNLSPPLTPPHHA